jgi:hypothetical protein
MEGGILTRDAHLSTLYAKCPTLPTFTGTAAEVLKPNRLVDMTRLAA